MVSSLPVEESGVSVDAGGVYVSAIVPTGPSVVTSLASVIICGVVLSVTEGKSVVSSVTGGESVVSSVFVGINFSSYRVWQPC